MGSWVVRRVPAAWRGPGLNRQWCHGRRRRAGRRAWGGRREGTGAVRRRPGRLSLPGHAGRRRYV